MQLIIVGVFMLMYLFLYAFGYFIVLFLRDKSVCVLQIFLKYAPKPRDRECYVQTRSMMQDSKTRIV